MQNQSPYTVIIAKGEFPTHQEPLSYIKNADRVICLDGAIKICLKNGITPDAIIGDGDSISHELRKKYAHLLHIYSDQETNDLTKAVTYCIKNGFTNIKVIAATGKREDHTLGNISLLLEYMHDCKIEMITDYGVFTPISCATEFQSMNGQQVSIFNIDGTPVTSNNLKYPLNEYVLDNLWKGTLNESLGDTFKIITSGKTLVYQTFQVK